MDIQSLKRKSLAGLKPYIPGFQPETDDFIRLNTNENPYPPSEKVLAALRTVSADQLRCYPDPMACGLRRKIAEIYGLGEDQIIVGNGSDEILRLVVTAFVDPGDTVTTVYPTYSLYETLIQIGAGRLDTIDLNDDYSMPPAVFEAKSKIFFVANPNSPAGDFSPDEIKKLCASSSGIVILDEAYVDFTETNGIPLLDEFPNLIVTRSFSKSFSLAGMRLGFGAASPEIVTELMAVKDIYNLSALTQAAGLAALNDLATMKENTEGILKTRDSLRKSLEEIGFQVYPSAGNFVLARCKSVSEAENLYGALRKKKILVRYFKERRLDDCLRITVGTDDEVDRLIDALKSLCL